MFTLLIKFIVSFQLAIGPAYLFANPNGGDSSSVSNSEPTDPNSPYGQLFQGIRDIENGGSPQIADNFHLSDNEHRQFHRIYGLENGREVLVKEIDLGAGLGSENEFVPVANFDREVRAVYDSGRKELRFERFLYSKELDREILTNSHVITNIELQTTEGSHILSDSNLIFFQAEDGLRTILKAMFVDVMFAAKLPMITVAPNPSQLVEGAQVKQIEFFTPEEVPRKLVRASGAEAGEVEKIAGVNDIMTRVVLPDGREVNLLHSYRRDILGGLSARLPYLLAQVLLVDPQTEDVSPITEVLQDYNDFHNINKMARSLVVSTVDNPASDLGDRSLLQLAQTINRDRLLGLVKKKAGKNEFDRLAGEEWDEFELEREWAQARQDIEDARVRRRGTILEDQGLTWRQALLSSIQGKDPELEAAMAAAAQVQEENQKRLFQKISERVRAAATPKRLKILAAVVSAEVVNLYTDNAINKGVVYLMSKTFDVLNYLPGMPGITEKIMESTPYFINSDFASLKVGLATLFVLNFRPLGYFAASLWAKANGESWNKTVAFFSAGARIFARASYPAWKLMWESLFKQVHLYESAVLPDRPRGMVNKIRQDIANFAEKNPFLNWLMGDRWIEEQRKKPTAYNPVLPQWVKSVSWIKDIPFIGRWLKENEEGVSAWIESHDEQIERNRQNMLRDVSERNIRNQRALVMAAMVVSERMRKEGTPLDPASMLLLLQAEEADQLERYLEIVNEAPPEVQWSTISGHMYKELVKISDKGISKADAIDSIEYFEALTKVARKYNRYMDMNSHLRGVVDWTRGKWNSFVTFTSKQAIPFMLFSPQGYELYQRYKTAEINARNSDSASYQFNEDYVFSTIFYAATDSKNYGAMATLNPAASAEIISNQLEQIFVYGLKAGVEFDQITMESIELAHPAKSQAAALVRRNQSEEDGGNGRAQTYKEGLREIFGQMLTPDSRRSILGSHMARMSVQTRGVQVNFLAGAVPKALALMVAAMATGMAFSDSGVEMTKAIPMQLNILFNKLALFYDSEAGFGMGYAVIWAAIVFAQNVIKDKAETNLNQLERIDSLFNKGIRWESEAHWRTAVDGIKELFDKNEQALPSEFNVPSEEYDLELARKLSIYSIKNPPFATLPSGKLQRDANLLGALVSTVLYVAISNAMWLPGAEIGPQLLQSLFYFGVTFMIANESKPVIDALLRKGHQVKDRMKGNSGNGGSGTNCDGAFESQDGAA